MTITETISLSKIEYIITLDSATYTVAYALDKFLIIRNMLDNKDPKVIDFQTKIIGLAYCNENYLTINFENGTIFVYNYID